MRNLRILVMVLLLLALLVVTIAAKPLKKKRPKSKLPVIRVETLFRVSEAPVSPKAKIFLVAGNSQAASFAREIVDQKRLWLAAGYAEDEIECYYVVPLQEDLNDDQAQFVPVAEALGKCHAASVKLLRAHLATLGARKPAPEFVYLYVTSHGDKPVSYTLQEAKPSDEDYWALQREAKIPVFDQYSMLVEGLTDGTATSPEIFGALRAGIDPRDLYLTPGVLKEALGHLEEVPKFVVLQGCFSGGFFEETSPKYRDELLSTLPLVTLLSAARHDRSSFGCEPGSGSTVFGGVINALLSHGLGDPRKMDWKSLWVAAQADILALEKREKMTPPSLPQYFSNNVNLLH